MRFVCMHGQRPCRPASCQRRGARFSTAALPTSVLLTSIPHTQQHGGGCRLSTVRKADHIVVMQQGKVEEEGTHEELVLAGGMYSSLVRRQQSGSMLSQEDPPPLVRAGFRAPADCCDPFGPVWRISSGSIGSGLL